MSNFELDGRLEVGNALVGTFRGSEGGIDQTFVIALVPDSLPPKAARETKEKIVLRAQEKFVRWRPDGDLGDLFNRLATPPLTMTIKDAGPAADMLDLALQQTCARNIIYCTNTQAYLSVCSKFGVSKRDLGSVAELNALIPRLTIAESKSGAVGIAHKVCYAIAHNRIFFNMPEGLQEMPPHYFEYVPEKIQRSMKFDCGPTNLIQEQHLKPLQEIEQGKRTLYLPAPICLLEYTLDDIKILLLAEKNVQPRGLEGPGIGLGKEGFRVSIYQYSKQHDECLIEPFSLFFKIKEGVLENVEPRAEGFLNNEGLNIAADLALRKTIEEGKFPQYCTLVLHALHLFNSPSYQSEFIQTPEKLKKARLEKIKKDPTEFPFFDYHVLKVPTQSERENFASRAAIARTASDPANENGFHQPFHRRRGYLRVTPYEDGSKKITVVDSYWAGDPTVGIKAATYSPPTPEA